MLSTNPQRSSSQQAFKPLESKPKVKNADNDEACGNVCKSMELLKEIDLENIACGKASAYPRKKGPACRRQVFADMECAESTARTLRPHGIIATAERCTRCNLIHLRESRIAQRTE